MFVLPTAQLMQPLAPEVAMYVPALQLMQVAAETREYLPATQVTQVAVVEAPVVAEALGLTRQNSGGKGVH